MKKAGKRNIWRLGMTLALSGAISLGGLMSASAEEGETLRVGSLLALGTVTPFVSEELGYYEESGLNVEVFEFADGAAIMEAFAAGELDVALVGIAPAATWYARGVDLKVVAGANGGGHVMMVRADSDIETVADLKDKMVAEPSIATVTDAMLRSCILKDAGLDPEMDVVLIPGMKPADMASSLMATQEVDAMITWEPYASQAMADYGDGIKVLYDAALEIAEKNGDDGFYPGNVVVARGDVIQERSEELSQFLEAHRATIDFVNSQEEEANEMIAGILQLDKAVVEAARTRTDFHAELVEETAMEVLQWSVDQGYLEELPDAEGFFQS